MIPNYLYKCTDCGTVQATSEDVGDSTWLLMCQSIRCQGMVKEFFRLDFMYTYAAILHKNRKVDVVCEKEVMGDDTDDNEDKET